MTDDIVDKGRPSTLSEALRHRARISGRQTTALEALAAYAEKIEARVCGARPAASLQIDVWGVSALAQLRGIAHTLGDQPHAAAAIVAAVSEIERRLQPADPTGAEKEIARLTTALAEKEAARAQAQHWLDEFQGVAASESIKLMEALKRAEAAEKELAASLADHRREVLREAAAMVRAHADSDNECDPEALACGLEREAEK